MTTKKRLGKFFAFIGDSELALEFARQNLCKAEAFEPYASFMRLDRSAKGYLTPRDLLAILRYPLYISLILIRDNRIDTGEELNAKQVISYFDSTGEGRLLYTE